MMDTVISEFLEALETGAVQVHKNMGLVPLFGEDADEPDYATLDESLDAGTLTVTELSEGGSVPELKVVNEGDRHTLMLDGEELKGAKQNRVLNTTILVAAQSETVVPVSCTEHGRWHYTSRAFDSSDVVMSPELRRRKMRAVHRSLAEHDAYAGDQGEVWNAVADQAARAQAKSTTGAMRDTFEARRSELAAYEDSFGLIAGQQGLLVLVDGVAIAFDALSRPAAYAQLHRKLVRSYAMDALLSSHADQSREPTAEAAEKFIAAAAASEDEPHESVGLGIDHRCTGETLMGSALVCQETVVHTAFFVCDDSPEHGNLAPYSRRRRFRTR